MSSDELLFHLAIGSRFENIEVVQVTLADCLERLGVEADACHWIDVAVREAVANAIKHGNRQDPDKRVAVDFSIRDGELVIRVEDEGEGFEPEDLSSPLDPANLLRPNGRGIFYMRSFMDRVEYEAGAGGGTAVVLHKKLAGEAAEEASP